VVIKRGEEMGQLFTKDIIEKKHWWSRKRSIAHLFYVDEMGNVTDLTENRFYKER